jgi:hypothetical protein
MTEKLQHHENSSAKIEIGKSWRTDTLAQLPTMMTTRWTCNESLSNPNESDSVARRCLLFHMRTRNRFDASFNTRAAIEMALVSGAATQVRSIDSAPDWDYHVAQAPIYALPSGSQHASIIPQHKVA